MLAGDSSVTPLLGGLLRGDFHATKPQSQRIGQRFRPLSQIETLIVQLV
jgi:hypothetical protein